MLEPISKSDYILYRDCHKNAWIKIHKPDIYYQSELSEFEKNIIETGNEVELVARTLFPGGISIEGRDLDSQKLTQEYLANKQPVLFQPVFVKDGFLAAADILQYDPSSDSYFIFEVKSSNEIDEKVHIYDLAFQVNLLRRWGLKISKASVIHLNKEYVRSGELNIVSLFTIEGVTNQIEEIFEGVNEEMKIAKDYLSNENEPNGSCCCLYKGRSKHCSTFHYSNPQVPEYSVHDVARIGSSKAKLTEMIDSGIFHIHEIPEHIKLSDIQKNQVDAHISDKVLINKYEIALELEKLVYPLYFLDYETFPAAIPRFDGFSPYQQIPFQYSLHILEKPDGELEHKEFIYTKPDDPSHSILESLRENIGDKGSVIVWSKKFECKINEELAKRIPSGKPFIDSINGRVYDLMDIFSKQHYVHKGFQGSTSIKYVLPVLVPELSYKELDIRDGGMACQSWNKITTTDIEQSEKDKITQNLKTYCQMDTYAMYAIWRELEKVI